jgi:hypothetical protein
MSRKFLKTRCTVISHIQQISLFSQRLVQNLVQNSKRAKLVSVLKRMSLLPNDLCIPHSVTSSNTNYWSQPDLAEVGHDIYDQLTGQPRENKQSWKRRLGSVEIKSDHLYSPKEVAAVLSVSYDTAVRIMSRLKRRANLAKPHAKKRLLRVKGSDLRDYIQGKLA